jgi:hypothetical protein
MSKLRSHLVAGQLVFYAEDTGAEIVGIDPSTGAIDVKAGAKFTIAGVDKTSAVGGTPSDASVTTAKLAAGAATLPKISFTGIKTLKGVGAAVPGAVTLTGAAVGDRVVAIIGNLTAGGPLLVFVPGTDFEAAISVINQIQQLSASDLHLTTIVAILAPATA